MAIEIILVSRAEMRADILKEYREILEGIGPLAIKAQTSPEAAFELKECIDHLVEAFDTVLD